jgi:hypothetical protein
MMHHSEDAWEIHVRDKILRVNDAILWINQIAVDNPAETVIVDHLLSLWKATQMLEDMVDLKRTLDVKVREARLENAQLRYDLNQSLVQLDQAKAEILKLQEQLI